MLRRDFLAHATAGGACVLTWTIAGCARKLTPAQARRAEIPFRILNTNEVTIVDALGETLLPGSAAAGLAHYLDHQLAGPPADSLLMIKYLRVEEPFTEFYRGGLRALDATARALNEGTSFADLTTHQRSTLVSRLALGRLDPWQGPPAGLFYFAIRADAVDVTFGTQAGFEKLGIPYMAHIWPSSEWGT